MKPPTAAGVPHLAQVAVDVAAEGADHLFTYTVPLELAGELRPGVWVEVPFGPRRLLGCYVGEVASAPAGVALRPILGVAAGLPPLPAPLLHLARWVADSYLCTFAAALRLTLPAAARRRQVRQIQVTEWQLAVPAAVALPAAGELERRAPLQARLLRDLANRGGRTAAELARSLGGQPRAALAALERRGLVVPVSHTALRNPFADSVPADQPPTLSPDQEAATAAVVTALNQGGTGRPLLLHGVTDSGKTEVYLRAIAHALALGRQAIVLVPEISLTPQTVARFRARFGDRVAVLHSALSAGERWDQWVQICQGQVDIAIGARSAVFAPFDRLGVIILDEEHEGTYKQDENPRYHAREVAEERARREGAALVLGSATPALETYHRTTTGEVDVVAMPVRIGERPLPPVQLVDMRTELATGNRSIFSRDLQAALRTCIAAEEQAILFLNRRGFHTFVLCRSCGESVQCPHCAVALTYHLQYGDRLECHWCGHTAPVPTLCPQCGSKSIRYLGAGTERVEEELARLFPGVRALRLDVDTARRKGAHGRILDAFGRGEADVLVGTQMVAKGLDFARVTLVGVVLADVTLNLPDFRATERTFQLVTQVAGRAGRGPRGGRVLVQTYAPEHDVLQAAQGHDYLRFFQREIRLRAALAYPPFAHFVRLILSGPNPEPVARAGALVRAALDGWPGFPGEVVGPAPAPLARLRGHWRHHLLVKGPDRAAMAAAVRSALGQGATRQVRALGVRLGVDVGPLSIL